MESFSVLDEKQLREWISSIGLDEPIPFYDYLKALESQEVWTFEKGSACYNQFTMIADELSNMLESSPARREPVIKKQLTDFLKILAYRNITASFRLLAILHKIQPALTITLIKICTTNQINSVQPEAMLFLSRIQILLKTECLKRIFGKKRRDEIITLLKDVKG